MTTDTPRLLPTPTITGTKAVDVGATTFHVPASAGVVMAGGGRIAYVLAGARLHCFTEKGEIEIPDNLRQPIARQHFGGWQR